ncbi:hypothetical protein M9H77_20151 [Catharanthus roseus]|uniref:Uncharacterized protein n=1 Tax=Catharanthus roseus TaxID=4058 RepID=A0ACC0ALG9_CATRO|nr:hypothetical protein M9H77_20151 [Catharanthus roseus]
MANAPTCIKMEAPFLSLLPIKFRMDFHQSHFTSKLFLSNNRSNLVNFKCFSVKNKESHKSQTGFSVLNADIDCDIWTILCNMAFYIFSMHVPLSFGGLSVIANTLNQRVLEPQVEALSIFSIQTIELLTVLLLLNCPIEPRYKLLDFFKGSTLSEERNWLLASAAGFLFLVFLVFLTSTIADQLLGPKEVNNPIVNELLSSSSISGTLCVLVYCVVTPLLEEIVYRGYLLTSLSGTMNWQKAVLVSSIIFSASHFSAENFLQLFIVGTVLGCSYCWTGNLSSSVLVHSLYNALTLFLTFISR